MGHFWTRNLLKETLLTKQILDEIVYKLEHAPHKSLKWHTVDQHLKIVGIQSSGIL